MESLLCLQFWDTAGQERFRSLNTAFYRDTDCGVLVFDVTKLASFNSLDSWLSEFRRNRQGENEIGEVPIVLVGNKADLEDSIVVIFHHLCKCCSDLIKSIIEVSNEQTLKWCRSHHGIPYFEVSSLTGYQIDSAFKTIANLASKGHLMARKMQKPEMAVDLKSLDREDEIKNKICCG